MEGIHGPECVVVGAVTRTPTQEEREERLRYWEARLRAINAKDPERAEAELQADLARRALPTGTFPETPDFDQYGNVDSHSARQNAGYSRGGHFQTGAERGNVAQCEAQQEVEDEIEALRAQRRGNVPARVNYLPGAIDDFVRGRLVTLLGLGLSIRQAAAAVGVSHTAVRQELKRNQPLMVQVELAREQARLEPLLVIIRESKRSWRAASWLMKHLDRKGRGGRGKKAK